MISAIDFVKLGLTRLHASLDKSLTDLSPEQLHAVPAGHPKANTIAWGLWHYARTEDNVVRYLLQDRRPTVWGEGGYAEKLGLPPVVAGLAVYLLLSRSGPLGSWGILFTPAAMVIVLSWFLFVPAAHSLTFAPGQGYMDLLPQLGWGAVGGWIAALLYVFALGTVLFLRWRSGAWTGPATWTP